MTDNDELLDFGSDDELHGAHSELYRHLQVHLRPLGIEQQGSRGSAAWERVDGSSQVDMKDRRQQQQVEGHGNDSCHDDEVLKNGRDGAGDELRGAGVTARLNEDDWLLSDIEEASPAPEADNSVHLSSNSGTPASTAQTRDSPTPPLGAELPTHFTDPPPRRPQPPSPSNQLDPFVLPERLPSIDEVIAARRTVGVDRTNTLPHLKDDLFDVVPSASSSAVEGVGLRATKSSAQGEFRRETHDEGVCSTATTGMESRAEATDGAGKRVRKEKKGKDTKKRKLDVGHPLPPDESEDAQVSKSSASASASQPSQRWTSQLSTTMPSVGDRFSTRRALLVAVSYASHSLGYTCKILRYPHGLRSLVKIGCPLHLPAGLNRCPANLNGTLKGDNGEWEVTMCSMAHNHEPQELGEWKAPKEVQMRKQMGRKPQEADEGDVRSSRAGRSQMASEVEPSSIDTVVYPVGGTFTRSDPYLTQSPAPPLPAPRCNLPSFTSDTSATGPLELVPPTSRQYSQLPSRPLPRLDRPMSPASLPLPSLYGLPRPSPPLSQPSIRDLDDALSLAFGSSTTSAPILLFPSDSALPHSQRHARRAFSPQKNASSLPSFHHPPPFAPLSDPLPSFVEPAPPHVQAQPSQAEMDAFFGYKGLNVEPDPELDGLPVQLNEAGESIESGEPEMDGSRFSAEGKGKGKAVVDMDEEEYLDGEPLDAEAKKEEPTEKQNEGAQTSSAEEPFQLQPIPVISPETGQPMTSNEKRLAIIDSLERIAVSILSQLVDGAVPPPPSFTVSGDLSKQSQWAPKPIVVQLAKRGGEAGIDPSLQNKTTGVKTRRIVFPRTCGGQKDSPKRFGARELAAFLKIVETIIDGLKNRSVSTKRDIFYRSVALFVKQTVVDSLVEDIAATLRVRRNELNVVAASKGLFAGHIKITTTDGITLEGGAQGALIPPSQLIEKIEVDEVKWVLIIEKEAVFHSLCSADFLAHDQLAHGVILTGKGYPDLSTRELVKRLSIDYPSLPLLCLVDSDPHGLEILSTYKYGSSALAFDRANLAVERIEWMAVKGSEWDRMGVNREELLMLTAGDTKKALKMLKREWWPEEWRRELEYMLHIQRKAEIQILLASKSNGNSIAYSQHSQSQPSQRSSASSSSTGSRAPSKLVEYVVSKLLDVSSVD